MLKITIASNNEVIGILEADAKQFKTGSRGYNGNGKMTINGKKHQIIVNIVEIGSKKAGERK